MYICNNCGLVFEDCKIDRQFHPYGMGYAAEEFAVCPHCNDTDFDEAKQCEMCGEFVAELEDGLCDCCHGDMYGKEE